MALTNYLLDTSVWNRARLPALASTIRSLSRAGRLYTCPVLELEAQYSATSPKDYEAMLMNRAALLIPAFMDDREWARALEVQAVLAGQGRHRAVGIADLLIAAAAERHGLTVLHYDSDFDVVTDITGQATEWVAPSGDL